MIRALAFILTLSIGASAEARRYVPLMPAKRAVAARKVVKRSTKTYSYRLPELGAGPDTRITTADPVVPAAETSSAPKLAPGAQSLGIGIEVGALSTVSDGGIAPGGRAYLRLPLWDRTYLKASLGYFYSPEGTITIPVTRHVFELGGTIQYSLVHSGVFRLLGGLAARVDLAMVNENDAFGQPITSFQTALRGGPALGALYGIAPTTSLSLDLEGTYSTAGKFLFGATAGVVFYWK